MPRDATDILAGMSDADILAEIIAGNTAVAAAWNRRHEQRMAAHWEAVEARSWAAFAPVARGVDEICAIPTERWERLGRVLRGEE